MSKTLRTRWNSCNVLQVNAISRQLWGFNASRNGFTLANEQSIPSAKPLPAGQVARDWKTLFQPKLNIAWLPVDQVFLRIAQLPAADFDETLAMVELQLEKLSPLAVTQIFWTIQILPQRVDNLQTVIVFMVARDLVQEYLGKLEGQGYLADRLELPMLDQLLAVPISRDGAWIYPGEVGGKFMALVAWWYGGALRNLGLVHVPAADNGDVLLKEQLVQMAWAGELEGWLTAPPAWHLVADATTAQSWLPLFRSWVDQPPEVIAPLPPAQLAALTANRAAQTEAKASLLPAEYSARYHQQFIDGLWMRGLGAVLMVYIAGVMIYFAALSVQNYRTDSLDNEVKGLSASYTNTLKLKAQMQVLQDRQSLKFAALDCWKITAEVLPESLTLQSLELKNGRTLTLSGTAPAEDGGLITDFNEALRKATSEGQPLFERMDVAITKLAQGGATLTWSFSGDLSRGEEPR